jgi:uncharacterized protein DUF6776
LALSLWWRRARQHFSIDAPRVAVRSRLPWPWRAVAALCVLLIVGGTGWWGYDFGQFFGGFNRKEVEARIATLEEDIARLRADNERLRAKSIQQESDLAIATGTRESLSKLARELQEENSQAKEELAFLQKLVADSSKQVGLSIQRLVVERERDDLWHYSLLLVRGGSPRDEFNGRLTLQVTLQLPDTPAQRPTTLLVPDEQPDAAQQLKLDFKYYQRLEGSIRVPDGSIVRAVTARAFESGQAAPRATRNLVLP